LPLVLSSLVLPLVLSSLVLPLVLSSSVGANAGTGVRVGMAMPIAYSTSMVATLIARIWFLRCLTSILVAYYPLLGIFRIIYFIWCRSDLCLIYRERKIFCLYIPTASAVPAF
jgi:hypothetical protein